MKLRFPFVSDDLSEGGSGWYVDDVQIDFRPTSVEEDLASVPLRFSLDQNYPNPFNVSTTTRFTLVSSQFAVHSPIHTTLRIYNVRGQLVKTLLDEEKQPGEYWLAWDGMDKNGKEVGSGIYFYQLVAGDRKITKKMLLLK